MAAASSTVNGYLTSTDWTTFNSKGSGTVTSVSATSPVTSTGGATPTIAIPAATTSASGYLTSTDWNTFNGKGSGTVTSVAALTLGTTGTDLSSSVATGTTTPVITLNVPTASASNRGVLSSADWTTFNNKGSGTVTSVAVTAPSIFSVAGSPITSSGTIALTYSGTALPILNGGTGQTTASAAFNALSPLTTAGDILYGATSGAGTRLGIGTAGQVLTVSVGGLPSWSTITAGNASYDTATTSTGYFAISAGTTAQRPVSPTVGMIRYNTTESKYEVYIGSSWQILNTSGYPYSVSYLAVAGGGAGGGFISGGGGAGGYLAGTTSLSLGTVYTVVVGAGGAGVSTVAGLNGGLSSIAGTGLTTISATGGGGGGYYGSPAGVAGSAGGSGGGGGVSENAAGGAGGAGTSGQGNTGGTAGNRGGSGSYPGGGGGGGSSAVGGNNSTTTGGAGGAGTASSITGSSVTYAGGGGGDGYQGTGGAGGSGGGGAGGTGTTGSGTAGTANTGGGGGGTSNGVGASGGSGVVILSVPTANYTGTTTGSPTITTSGSNTIIKFTASGTYTA
jgi:hypothetical protein